MPDLIVGQPTATQAATAPANRLISFEDRLIQVPGDATDAEIAEILDKPPAAPAQAPVQRGPQMTPEEADVAVSGLRPQPAATPAWAPLRAILPPASRRLAQGAVQGLDMLADAQPVHAVNQAPRLLNLNAWLVNKIMGRDVVPYAGAISDDPLLQSDIVHAPDRALGARRYEPQGPVERIVNRAGQELGASAVPTIGRALRRRPPRPPGRPRARLERERRRAARRAHG